MSKSAAYFENVLGDRRFLEIPPWMEAEAFACALTYEQGIPWRVSHHRLEV